MNDIMFDELPESVLGPSAFDIRLLTQSRKDSEKYFSAYGCIQINTDQKPEI